MTPPPYRRRPGRRVAALACGAALVLLTGCPPEPPPPTRVELVNQTSRDLTPHFFNAGRPLDAAELFVPENELPPFVERPFQELPPGGSVTLLYDCDSDWTLGVRRPRAFEPTTLTVFDSPDEIVLRQGVEFQCGQLVRVIYYFESGVLRVRTEVE